MSVRRTVGQQECCFLALVGEDEVGECEVCSDLFLGGELPALRDWGELSSVLVADGWRNRGIGTWLVQWGVSWLQMSGRTRIILSLDRDAEARGAGRFYERFGWQLLARQQRGWTLTGKGTQ